MDSHRRNQDVSEYSYQKNRSKLSNSNCFCSGIINLLFDGLAYNTADILLIARIFPRPCGARKNTTQLAKYPHVLYAKPSNKVYILDKFAWTSRLRKQKQKLTNLSRIEIRLVILNEKYQMFLSKGKQSIGSLDDKEV